MFEILKIFDFDFIQYFLMPLLVLIQFIVAVFRFISAKKQLALKGTDFWVREHRRLRNSVIILGSIFGGWFIFALPAVLGLIFGW